jgi:hypothetical protein
LKFARGNGLAVLVGSDSGSGCAKVQGGSVLTPRLPGPVVESRNFQAAARLAGPATVPLQLTGTRAPKPREGSCTPHLVGLSVKHRMWE